MRLAAPGWAVRPERDRGDDVQRFQPHTEILSTDNGPTLHSVLRSSIGNSRSFSRRMCSNTAAMVQGVEVRSCRTVRSRVSPSKPNGTTRPPRGVVVLDTQSFSPPTTRALPPLHVEPPQLARQCPPDRVRAYSADMPCALVLPAGIDLEPRREHPHEVIKASPGTVVGDNNVGSTSGRRFTRKTRSTPACKANQGVDGVGHLQRIGTRGRWSRRRMYRLRGGAGHVEQTAHP